MIVKKIQQQIEMLYRFASEYDAEHFLISTIHKDKNQIQIGHRLGQEALLIKQSNNDIEIGLFVEASLLKHLEQDDPYLSLHENNLNAFCTAVEGVSHFLYLVDHVERGQPVTQLELELQAEIDKYILASFLYYQHTREVPSFLFSYLFENFTWQKNLSENEKCRYSQANYFAAKFCAHLEQNYIRYQRWPAALEAARQFYHLNHWEKLRALTP